MKLSFTYKQHYYDILYDAANELFLTYNPCRFNSKGECFNNRYHEERVQYIKNCGCCSLNCRYMSPKGCLTKSLGCKLYVCSPIEKSFPEFCKELMQLKEVLWRYNLPWNVYSSKEDWVAEYNRDAGTLKGLSYVLRRATPHMTGVSQ